MTTNTNEPTTKEILQTEAEKAIVKDVDGDKFTDEAETALSSGADLDTLFKNLDTVLGSALDKKVFRAKIHKNIIDTLSKKIKDKQSELDEIDQLVSNVSQALSALTGISIGIDIDKDSGSNLLSLMASAEPFPYSDATNLTDYITNLTAGLTNIKQTINSKIQLKREEVISKAPKIEAEGLAAHINNRNTQIDREQKDANDKLDAINNSVLELQRKFKKIKLSNQSEYDRIKSDIEVLTKLKDNLPTPDFEQANSEFQKICNAQYDKSHKIFKKPKYNRTTGEVILGDISGADFSLPERVQLFQTAASTYKSEIKTNGLQDIIKKDAESICKKPIIDTNINRITAGVKGNKRLSISQANEAVKRGLSSYIDDQRLTGDDLTLFLYSIALAYNLELKDNIPQDELQKEVVSALLGYIKKDLPTALPTVDSLAEGIKDSRKNFREAKKPEDKEIAIQRLAMSTRYNVSKEVLGEIPSKNLKEMSPAEIAQLKSIVVTKILELRLKNMKEMNKSADSKWKKKLSEFGFNFSEKWTTDNRGFSMRKDLISGGSALVAGASVAASVLIPIDGGFTLAATKGLVIAGSIIGGRMAGQSKNIYDNHFGKYKKIEDSEDNKAENEKISHDELQDRQAAILARGLKYGGKFSNSVDEVMTGIDGTKYPDVAESINTVKNLMSLEKEALTKVIGDYFDKVLSNSGIKDEAKMSNVVIANLLDSKIYGSDGTETIFMRKLEEAKTSVNRWRYVKPILNTVGVGVGVGTGWYLL